MKIYLDPDEIKGTSVSDWPVGAVLIFRYSGCNHIFATRNDGMYWEYTKTSRREMMQMRGDFEPIAIFIPEETDR